MRDDKKELSDSMNEIIDNFKKERERLIIHSKEEIAKISSDRKKELSKTRDDLIKLFEDFENKINNRKKLILN